MFSVNFESSLIFIIIAALCVPAARSVQCFVCQPTTHPSQNSLCNDIFDPQKQYAFEQFKTELAFKCKREAIGCFSRWVDITTRFNDRGCRLVPTVGVAPPKKKKKPSMPFQPKRYGYSEKDRFIAAFAERKFKQLEDQVNSGPNYEVDRCVFSPLRKKLDLGRDYMRPVFFYCVCQQNLCNKSPRLATASYLGLVMCVARVLSLF